MSTKLTAPLKWHGGKAYLADWILSHAPPRVKNPNAPAADDPGYIHYVEPFAGGLQVLLANDPEGISEVVNDKNRLLVNFWRVLQSSDMFGEFQRTMEATPFCEEMFIDNMVDGLNDDPRAAWARVESAVGFLVHCRQSLAGRMKGFTGVTKTRTRRGMNNEVSAWLTAIEGLPAVHARLKRVLILNRDAIDVIKGQDGLRTWFYCDPPYLHETRATTGEYAHEMTYEQHEALLHELSLIKGRFALSGYSSDLYNKFAYQNGWRCETFETPNHAAGGKEKRTMTECLWMNY